MKIILAFIVLIAGISALPQQAVTTNERFITDFIVVAVENVSKDIQDAGLDPLIVQNESANIALPVPVIFEAAASVVELISFGLSKIIINDMRFAVFSSRLNFDIELPHIHLSINSASAGVTLFGRTIQADASGSIDIRHIRAVGVCNINVGVITGIFVRNVDMDFTLNAIDSNLQLTFEGKDVSNELNHFLGNTIPYYLTSFKNEMDLLIEILLLDIINSYLI